MSHWILLHELLLTGELDNEHVPIRNNSNSSPQQRTLKSPERKNNLLSQPNSCSRQGNTVMLSTKQLKRTALRSMFLQKVPEERLPACSASPLTDSTLQRSYTAGHADPVWHAWPFLGRTAGSPCSTHRLAEKATPCHAGSAITALLAPASPYCHLRSRQVVYSGLNLRQPLNLRGSHHKTRPYHQNLAVI